jgi:AcrR family transcriptional regulator
VAANHAPYTGNVPEHAPQPLPSGRRGLDPEQVAASQRGRLIDAMVVLSSDVGYEQITIADLTTQARTAKRTFYAHFAAREDCFLAAYDRVDAAAFDALLRGASTADAPFPRIRAALEALLTYLADHPKEARLWVLDSRGVGPRASAQRVQTTVRLADLYLALHAEIAPTLDPPVPMSRIRALAVAGALELPIAAMLQSEGPAVLPELTDELSRAAYTLVYGEAPPA